jgi:hypothetical protein
MERSGKTWLEIRRGVENFLAEERFSKILLEEMNFLYHATAKKASLDVLDQRERLAGTNDPDLHDIVKRRREDTIQTLLQTTKEFADFERTKISIVNAFLEKVSPFIHYRTNFWRAFWQVYKSKVEEAQALQFVTVLAQAEKQFLAGHVAVIESEYYARKNHIEATLRQLSRQQERLSDQQKSAMQLNDFSDEFESLKLGTLRTSLQASM